MKNIAVIGGGISGLAAAYLLSRKHRVTLYEREPRLGGHTHTIVVADQERGDVPLDTGFLVHNDVTYPNLVRLFADTGVETQPSDMSFSVTCPDSGFEYSSRGATGFFAQRRNVLRFEHYLLLRDILRFNREAIAILDASDGPGATLGDYLDANRYSEAFVHRYLVPMTSAIWSSSFEGIRQFPAQMLVRFMRNHGMLSVGAQPLWRVVRGGSHAYLPQLAAPISAVCLGARLQSVTRGDTHVTLAFFDRPPQRFDEVVFACHGDQVLRLLLEARPSGAQVTVLFEDYRNLRGTYDKIVSIEMFEAIGLDYYDEFFGACDRLLGQDGVMLLQTITVDDWRFREYRGANWISKYIFPGAELASVAEVLASLARTSRMSLYHAEQIGTHYARTLHDWRERFHRHIDEVRAQGFDDRFIRMWDLYLGYCEAAFLDRHIGDMQLVLTKDANRRVLYGEPWAAQGSITELPAQGFGHKVHGVPFTRFPGGVASTEFPSGVPDTAVPDAAVHGVPDTEVHEVPDTEVHRGFRNGGSRGFPTSR